MTDQEKAFIEYCISGNLLLVETCIKYGLDVNVENSWGIQCASKFGHWKIVTYLLDNGVTFEAALSAGVLENAAYQNQLALVDRLIKSSAIFKQNNRALQWAAMQGHKEIVEKLITYLDDINGTLVSAAQNGKIEIVEMLIDNDLAQADISKQTVLHRTAKNSHWKVVQLLENNNIVDIATLSSTFKEKYDNWKNKHGS